MSHSRPASRTHLKASVSSNRLLLLRLRHHIAIACQLKRHQAAARSSYVGSNTSVWPRMLSAATSAPYRMPQQVHKQHATSESSADAWSTTAELTPCHQDGLEQKCPCKAQRCSHTGTQTRVCWVKATYPNRLDYVGRRTTNQPASHHHARHQAAAHTYHASSSLLYHTK